MELRNIEDIDELLKQAKTGTDLSDHLLTSLGVMSSSEEIRDPYTGEYYVYMDLEGEDLGKIYKAFSDYIIDKDNTEIVPSLEEAYSDLLSHFDKKFHGFISDIYNECLRQIKFYEVGKDTDEDEND